MNVDSNYVFGFKSVVEDIVKAEVKKTGITTYISAIVQKINNDGTVDVYLPPDKQNLVTGIFNRCGEELFVGDSVEIATKNGSLTNAWVFVKHGTNINGSSAQLEEMASEVVVKVSNGRLKTSALNRNAVFGNALTIISDDINLDGMNINLNGSRGITITSPYFTVTKTGVIGATSGVIGGWNLGNTKLYSGSGTNYVGLDSGTSGQNYAIWAGDSTSSSAPFSVTRAGKVKASNIEITGGSLNIGSSFVVTNTGAVTASNINITGGSFNINSNFNVTNSGVLTATGATINGNITATSGRIAEYVISGAQLIGNNVGLSGTSGQGYAFWAGSNTASSAPFRVGHDGSLMATNANISGLINATRGEIGGCSIVGGQLQIANANIGSLTVDKITSGTNTASLTFNGAVSCTNITASGGTIGGWNMSSTQIYKGSTHLYNTGRVTFSNGDYFFTMGNGSNHPVCSSISARSSFSLYNGLTATGGGTEWGNLSINGTRVLLSATGNATGGVQLLSTKYISMSNGTAEVMTINCSTSNITMAGRVYFNGGTYAGGGEGKTTGTFKVDDYGGMGYYLLNFAHGILIGFENHS